MNEADSGRVAAELDALGFQPTGESRDADVIVLNTCVVRQSAEDRAVGQLWSLKPLKDRRPDRVIALMGCMVGVRPNPALAARFPFVDVFMPPSDPSALVDYLSAQRQETEARELESSTTSARHEFQDELSPEASAIGLIADHSDTNPTNGASIESRIGQRAVAGSVAEGSVVQSLRHISLSGVTPIVANVPVVYGCSLGCSFCIIPLRRGAEHSRPLGDIVREVRGLVMQGVREVTLLGQIVDRYGRDFPGGRPDLADLLEAVHQIDGLWRVRFLTSHPNYMSDRILVAVAQLSKVCEQIEVPVQAGDDEVLNRMKRRYSTAMYRELIAHIRAVVPDAAIHTDVIVGFPGETDRQFQATYDLLAQLKLDKAHLAMYSPRPGTGSSRHMADDVPADEKKRRWDALDALQAQVVGEINSRLLGNTVEVLVEDMRKGRWRGRTRTGKLVFFDHPQDLRGRSVNVRVTWAGPWSLIGEFVIAG